MHTLPATLSIHSGFNSGRVETGSPRNFTAEAMISAVVRSRHREKQTGETLKAEQQLPPLVLALLGM